jgi:hypothetical protein
MELEMETEHSQEILATHRLASLRALGGEAAIFPGKHIVPGVWFDADIAQGDTAGAISSHPNGLLWIRSEVQRPCRWLSLNFALNCDAMSQNQMVGVILSVETAAPVGLSLRLRTGQSDAGFVDSHFSETRVAHPICSTHVNLLPVRGIEALAKPAPWRNLMIWFEPTRFELTLLGIHIFARSIDENVEPETVEFSSIQRDYV